MGKFWSDFVAEPKSEVFRSGFKIETMVEKCMVESFHNGSHNRCNLRVIHDPIALWIEFALAMDPQFVAVSVKSPALVPDRHFGELMGSFKCKVLPEFKFGVEAEFFVHRN